MTQEKTNEIEVTEEMIQAGLEELLKYRADRSNEEETLSNIFKAMIMAFPDAHQYRS